MYKTGSTVFCVLLVCFLLTACAGQAVVPVSDRSPGSNGQARGDAHIVKSGDTMYSIAFASGVDYRELAAWNKIPPPYVIYPGQKVNLKQPPEFEQAALTLPLEASESAIPEPLPNADNQTVQNNPPEPEQPAQVTEEPQPSSQNTTQPSLLPKQVKKWSWPADGKLVEKFSVSRGNKGIDISGTPGAPVQAAAHGRVVYAGSGLRGYGQLIIVQHSDTFLSAYAHNQRLLVREGDDVRRGQTISEMGNTGTDSVKLHFEIRKQGEPIDPLTVLPPRST